MHFYHHIVDNASMSGLSVLQIKITARLVFQLLFTVSFSSQILHKVGLIHKSCVGYKCDFTKVHLNNFNTILAITVMLPMSDCIIQDYFFTPCFPTRSEGISRWLQLFFFSIPSYLRSVIDSTLIMHDSTLIIHDSILITYDNNHA